MDYEKPRRSIRAVRIIGMVIAGIVFAILFALLFGWLVMLLWNWLMPAIFGITTITYGQAFGITILAKILFGSMHGSHGFKDRAHDTSAKRFKRWMSLDDDGWGHFSREDMRRFREFWKDRGAAAFKEFLNTGRPSGEPHS